VIRRRVFGSGARGFERREPLTKRYGVTSYRTRIINFEIYICVCVCVCRVAQSVDYRLDGPGSNPGGDEIFRPTRPALWPTQPPVKWVPGLSRG